jgi:hypothetical protein
MKSVFCFIGGDDVLLCGCLVIVGLGVRGVGGRWVVTRWALTPDIFSRVMG